MTSSQAGDLGSFSYEDASMFPRIPQKTSALSALVTPPPPPPPAAAISVSISGSESADRNASKIRPTRVSTAPAPNFAERSASDALTTATTLLESAVENLQPNAERRPSFDLSSAIDSQSTIDSAWSDARPHGEPSFLPDASLPVEPPHLAEPSSLAAEPSSAASPSAQSQSPAGVPGNALDALLLAMSGSKNRVDAVVTMVEWFAKATPGVAVRCGIGTSKLKRLFDSRLGWLGSESSLHRELGARWHEYTGDGAGSTLVDSQLTIRLSRSGQRRMALLCLQGEALSREMLEGLKAHETLLGSILLGRPSIAIPHWALTRGRPRLAIAIAVLMVMLLLICPVPYRASCTVRVEPINARVVSAPFEATVETVLVEPGSEVKAGDALVTLDGRPLRLELQSLEAEIQQAAKQSDIAMAGGKIADAQLAQLKGQQLQRQRDLILRRLNQLIIACPIDGVVVAGDLRRSIGVPLEVGQVLFEIASLERVMIEVEIPEREIGLVSEDSPAQFRVDSSRAGTLDAALNKIYPSAQLRDDESVFVAPIEIDNEAHQYRPGMRGKATVFGPIRPWAWTHVRGLFDQLSWWLGL